MRALLAIFASNGLLLAACVQVSDTETFTQAKADAIVRECAAREGILWAEGGTARFEPPQDLSYDVSVCLLNGIKDSGATKIGFVGNEKYTEPMTGEQLPPEVASEIEGICGLPAGALTGTSSVPDIREVAPRMACAVAEARKRNFNVGFISNPVDPDAQTH